jgi:hypothetical protein
MSRHPNIIFPHEQFDYKTTGEDTMKKHHQSVHVINISSNSLEVQPNQPGGHPLSCFNLSWSGDLLFLGQKMHHLHHLPHFLTSHQDLIKEFGSPAEPAWGPPPCCVNLSWSVDLLFLVQKMHHLHLLPHFFTSHQHASAKISARLKFQDGPSVAIDRSFPYQLFLEMFSHSPDTCKNGIDH